MRGSSSEQVERTAENKEDYNELEDSTGYENKEG